ncbi:TPA: hypothetical protein ACOEQH_001634 [Stenotrophomonas maltophilia]
MSDESNGVGDFLKDLRGAWSNRIANPLIGSFALSWAAVNYRAIVVLLAGSSFEEKFAYIDSDLYPNFSYALLKCFVLPLTFALLYIYALPRPTERVYQRALEHQRELNNIAKSVADEKLLSAAESAALMDRAEKMIAEARADAAEKVEKANNELTAALTLADEQTARAAKELGSVARLVQTHEAELAARDSELNRRLSEIAEKNRFEVQQFKTMAEASDRRAASLSWALTFERAISASHEEASSNLMARLFDLLTAKQVTLFVGSMEFGSIKFTKEYGFIDSQGLETRDWLSWTLSDRGRIAVYDSSDREVASFLWRPRERRWHGTTSGRDAQLVAQAPTE